MARAFERRQNQVPGQPGTGDINSATHINELQVAIEEESARVDVEIDETGALRNVARPGDVETLADAMDRIGRDHTIDATAFTGVDPSGLTDSAAGLIAFAADAAATGKLGILPPGTYQVASAWNIPSGAHIDARGATILNRVPGLEGRAMTLTGVSDVAIRGLVVDGDKTWFADASEWRHNIGIYGGENITLEDMVTKDAKGDGIYLAALTSGSTDAPRNITFRNVTGTGNHRNNLTIISVDGFRSYGSSWTGASGTNPQAGVDIEPNFNAEIVRNIEFHGDRFDDNVSYGFVASLKTGVNRQGGIRFYGGSINGNDIGTYLYNAYDIEFFGTNIDGNDRWGTSFQGLGRNVSFHGGSISDNGQVGLYGRPNDSGTGDPGSIYNLKVIGTDILDNGQVAANTYDGVILAVDGSGEIDGVLFDGCRIGNLRSATQRRPSETTAAVNNLTFVNNDVRNNLSAPVFNDDPSTRIRRNNRGITTVQSFAAGATIPPLIEIAQATPSAAMTLILPANPEWEREYRIIDANGQSGTHPVTIQANTGHNIRGASPLTLNTAFATVTLIFRANNWYIVGRSG